MLEKTNAAGKAEGKMIQLYELIHEGDLSLIKAAAKSYSTSPHSGRCFLIAAVKATDRSAALQLCQGMLRDHAPTGIRIPAYRFIVSILTLRPTLVPAAIGRIDRNRDHEGDRRAGGEYLIKESTCYFLCVRI